MYPCLNQKLMVILIGKFPSWCHWRIREKNSRHKPKRNNSESNSENEITEFLSFIIVKILEIFF